MEIDFLIVGQGIAGSCLALHLLEAKKRILVINDDTLPNSSRVAAGLFTPITGKNFNPSWRQDTYLPFAQNFYAHWQQQLHTEFFFPSPILRIFQDVKEREKWRKKADALSIWAHETSAIPKEIKAPFGALYIPEGAWLHTEIFLNRTRDFLLENQSFRNAHFFQEELSIITDGITYQDIQAKKVILCQGARGLMAQEGWFSKLPHRCCKGEALTVRIDELHEGFRYHAQGWAAPRGQHIWKIGATYQWDTLDSLPTPAGKQKLLTQIGTWLDGSITTLNHQAGIRPILRNSRPYATLHSQEPSIGFFNGLGSKGSLMAPAVSHYFSQLLCQHIPCDPELTLHLD